MVVHQSCWWVVVVVAMLTVVVVVAVVAVVVVTDAADVGHFDISPVGIVDNKFSCIKWTMMMMMICNKYF